MKNKLALIIIFLAIGVSGSIFLFEETSKPQVIINPVNQKFTANKQDSLSVKDLQVQKVAQVNQDSLQLAQNSAITTDDMQAESDEQTYDQQDNNVDSNPDQNNQYYGNTVVDQINDNFENKEITEGVTATGNVLVALNAIDPETGSKKEVSLIELKLSEQYKKEIDARAKNIFNVDSSVNSVAVDASSEEAINVKASASTSSTAKVDLGMANVKVFDQGQFGTCATFSTSAALDAKMKAGDFISQQCTLELGNALAAKGEGKSGWDGLDIQVALTRFQQYGVFKNKLCAHSYGFDKIVTTPEKYVKTTKKLWADKVSWNTLKPNDIDELKAALDNNHRVIISTMLHTDYVSGEAIIDAKTQTGLWQLPSDDDKRSTFLNDLKNGRATGHGVIVTGYDDEKGLLKIRNSWGTGLGDKGDYYMTYDFYKLMNMKSLELQ